MSTPLQKHSPWTFLILCVVSLAIVGAIAVMADRHPAGPRAIQPGPATQTIVSTVSADGNVVVTSPQPDEVIGSPLASSPLAILGEAPGAGTVSWRLRSEFDTVIAEGTLATDQRHSGLFSTTTPYLYHPGSNRELGSHGVVEVFTSSNDGSPRSLASIPVTFAQASDISTPLYVYFTNVKQYGAYPPGRPETYAFERQVTRTSVPAYDILAALLKGPTQPEAAAGAHSAIPAGVRIRNLSTKNGVANVDFSGELLKDPGNSATIRAQIVSTLEQFSTIREVNVTVDGGAGFLEP